MSMAHLRERLYTEEARREREAPPVLKSAERHLRACVDCRRSEYTRMTTHGWMCDVCLSAATAQHEGSGDA